MLRNGFGDMTAWGGGVKENALINESSSQQRTAKARAYAANVLMKDKDDACLSLLPDYAEKRISLHRQLRGRYNPTQVPLCSLSCSAYLSADDIAQLAALFRDFNLFSDEVIDTLDSDESNGNSSSSSSSNREGQDETSATAGGTATAATVKKGRSPSPRPGSKARAVAPSGAKSGGAGDAVSLPEVDVTQGRVGMGLLRCIARPPPTVSPEGSSTPSGPRAGGVETATARAALQTPLPTAPSALRRAEGGTIAQMPTRMAVAGRCELSEPFTSESSDAALSMGWLVELLLEMVIANSADAVNISCGGGGAVSAAAPAATTPGPPPPLPVKLPSQPSPGNNTHPFHQSPTHTASVCLSTSPTTVYQARRHDARMAQLCHFKAELTAWAEHLAQKCDEREHRAAWQQCAVQEKILQRYQACVGASLCKRPSGSSLSCVPGGTSAGHPSRVDALGFANLEATGVLMNSKVGGSALARGGDGTGKLGSISWALPDAAAPETPKDTSSPKELSARSAFPQGSAEGQSKPPTALQSRTHTAAVLKRHPEIRGHSGTNGIPSTPPIPSDGGDTTPMLSPTDVCHSTSFSLTESISLLPPNFTEGQVDVGPPSANLWATEVGGGATDRSLLAVKARFGAPALKELLQQPAELYAYLWTSSTAARASELEGDNYCLNQPLGVARAPISPQVPGVHGSPGCGTISRPTSGSCGRRNRIASVQCLVCWSDVASNLLMGLETTWFSQRQDASYVRVPTVLFEDTAEGVASKTGLPGRCVGAAGGVQAAPHHFTNPHQNGDDDDESLIETALGGNTSSGAGVAGGGQASRRRLRKGGLGKDAAALHQRAMLLNSLDAAAEKALSVLHRQSADHLLVPPGQRYMVTSSKDGLLKVWDTKHGQFVSTILNVGQSLVLAMNFLHGGEFLMVATSAAEITIVNFPAGGVLLKLRGCTSLATAVTQVRQPSTVYTKRYGLKPGECGRHKPARSDSGSWLGAAAASRLMEDMEAESEPILARPIVGYVAPTAAFYDAENSFFFFGTLCGMIGCVDMTTVLSRTALHAAATGAGWSSPLHVHSSVFAHTEMYPPEVGTPAVPSTEMPLKSLECTAPNSCSPTALQRTGRAASLLSGLPEGATGATRGAGVQVGHLFFCSVGHCVVSSDHNGGIVRTPFAAAVDTLDCTLGTPTVVTVTPKPIRLMVGSGSGRRFVTVHSDRRAYLWAVGRTSTECLHQYPQEAYDIIDVCFVPLHQQVALLMANHSIRIYDERGSRPLTSILPPRGLSSRVEDMASMTLKYSAMDFDGCLAYLPMTQRLVCGLRGPILYELSMPASRQNDGLLGATAGLEMSVRTDVTQLKRRSNPADAASTRLTEEVRAVEVPTKPSPSSPESFVLPPPVLVVNNGSCNGPTATSHAAMSQSTNLALQSTSAAHASAPVAAFGSEEGVSGFDVNITSAEDEEARAAAAAAEAVAQEEAQRQRQMSDALKKCHERLQPYQTHSSAVIGLLLDTEHRELHSFSSDTWCVWQYETGKLLRGPLHVPLAAEQELALRGRRALLTCCSWSTEGRTRVLAGTRDSRVLTLDTRVGAVVSSTDPFVQKTRGLMSGTDSRKASGDKDISAMCRSGNRAVLCSGRVCEVRRYEVTASPKPSGEEEFICMRVELPSVASPVVPPVAQGGGATVAVGTATAAAKATKSTTGTTPGSCSDATITACCVVRESHLCLGTADTQLFFYRMVDNSSPLHVEVLCDMYGVPDVGRVVSLNYLGDTMRDVLLAVVDTGVLFVYSYTQQRMLGRYNFPLLGSNALADAPRAFAPHGFPRDPRRQEHYITSVGLAREVTGTPKLSSLIIASGDSAGYVHIVSLTKLLSEVSCTTPREEGVGGAARAYKTGELRASASFRASSVGLSSLEMLFTDPYPKAVDRSHGSVTKASSSTEQLTQYDRGSNLGGSLRMLLTPVSEPSTMPFFDPHLLVFAGGFDGNVRLFRLSPSALTHSELPPAFSHLYSSANSVWPPLHSQHPVSNAGSQRLSSIAARSLSLTGRNSFLRTFDCGRASLSSLAVGVMRYEVTTVGLHGVDSWVLGDPNTFSDVEQAVMMIASRRDGSAGIVLQSILDDVKSGKGGTGGCDAATVAGSGTGERVHAARVVSTLPQESKAMLLYDILRSSKKQHLGSPTFAPVANAQQLSHQPRLAETSTGPLADGAALLQGPSTPGSRSPPLPSAAQSVSPTTRTAVGRPQAVATLSGKEDAGANRGIVRCPGSCVSATPAPEPFPRPPPPPLHLLPHTIGELVRDTLPSSWNRSFTTPGVIAALSSSDSPIYGAEDYMGGGDAQDVLVPHPYSHPTPNRLVRMYPVSLLRHMGLVHPLDTTPDVDPETGTPLLISAGDVSKLWKKARLPGSENKSTATLTPMSMGDSFMISSQSMQPALPPMGLDSVPYVPRYSSTISSTSSFDMSIPRYRRRMTAVSSQVQVSSICDAARISTTEAGEMQRSTRLDTEDTSADLPVFLTEGGIDRARARSPYEMRGGSVSHFPPPAASLMQMSVSPSSRRSIIVDERPFSADADWLQRVAIREPPTTVLKAGPDATGNGGEAPSRGTALSANPGPYPASANRSRQPVLPPATPAVPQPMATQKLTYLRSALKDVDADVIRIRSDQMMLSHIANQLDVSLRALPPPLPAPESASAPAGNVNLFSSSTRGTHTCGNYTAQLMRLWRQRSGDAVVTAAMAAIDTFRDENAAGAPGTWAAEDASTTTNVQIGTISSTSDATAARGGGSRLADDGSLISEMKTSGRKGPERPMMSLAQRDPTAISPSRSSRRQSHGSQSNPLMAYASMLQAGPSSAFGVELLTLTLPSEPQAGPTRLWRQAGGHDKASLSARAAASSLGRGAEATVSATSANAASSKSVPHLGTRLPMIALQQKVQPIQVSLPSTLRSDEGERIWLRRFEAVFNSTGTSNKR
ncbi:hypothetical protein JKF63_05631 [Porcisia hertigi]|uniref:Guanine nucleotide-binding protein subunit beta-like protein n=1 Tax=Porcisia hertigi TaxID=2761500 RepID=A0A836IE42_9TRYP|nr:hypothetical protein JKF63_05631 [Porcisia hertigi]